MQLDIKKLLKKNSKKKNERFMFLQRIKEKLPGNKLIKLNNLSKQILRIFPFFFAFFNINYSFMVDHYL